MRLALALALACSVIGCRKTPPAGYAPDAAPVAAPAPAAVPASQPAPAEPPAEATTPADQLAAAPAPAAPPAPQAPARDEKLPVVEVPFPAVAQASPAKPDDEHDDRIYTWVDGQNVVHYGSIDEVPPARRKSARVVESGVTVVSPLPLEAPARSEAASAPAPASAGDDQAAGRRGRGPQPELDEKGLPIPGTMDDTAATQAAKAAGEKNIDPAAVERRRQEELRRMNCKEKDGVWVCG